MRGRDWLVRLQRMKAYLASHRRTVSLASYCLAVAAAYMGAFALRFDFEVPPDYAQLAWRTLPLIVLVRLVWSHVFGLSRGRWRYAGSGDIGRLIWATLAGSVVIVAIAIMPVWDSRIPISILVVEPLLTIVFTVCMWLMYRAVFEWMRPLSTGVGRSGSRRVLIIGAGEAAYMLAHEMKRSQMGLLPVGFVDDDPYKWGTFINGLEVIGSNDDLEAISRTLRADEIVIAIPSASPLALRRIVEKCERTGLEFRVLPPIRDVLAGRIQVGQLRPIQIEDLLGRDPISLDLPELAEDLAGKAVLITGAAGSIGSELSRQVALHTPETLVLFDHAETSLYFLELELRERHPALNIVPVIGDIVDAGAVERVFRRFQPQRVFHAAAYKHVPMMEINAREAIRNNVLGTWRVADAAGRFGAGKFVLVSTDKAVRPVSVMGATKRMAEIVILELQSSFPLTAFAAVRFGNVLGSNGSVIPIFQRQLEDGKPLTVTHPEATRYFMTIPEAVQLILQASLLPELRGNIAMLEMGDPVRIIELARNLLRLSGEHGSLDKKIVFTGLRPGERMHEELVAPDERTVPTPISKVRIVQTTGASDGTFLENVPEWSWALDLGDEQSVMDTVLGIAGHGPSKLASENPFTRSRHAKPVGAVASSRIRSL